MAQYWTARLLRETGKRRKIFEELPAVERQHATHWEDTLRQDAWPYCSRAGRAGWPCTPSCWCWMPQADAQRGAATDRERRASVSRLRFVLYILPVSPGSLRRSLSR